MSDKNLELWGRVKTPDPKYTKKVSMRGGFTATSPQYLIMLATREFGAYGAGFGLSESSFDFALLEDFKIAIHNAKFFYIVDGVRSEFIITNTVEVVSKNGHVDSDFAKKAETNTLCKALSKIGFAADVYMGLFDDGNYVQDAANEQAISDAIDKDAERAKQASELLTDTDNVITQINESKLLTELEGLYKSMARKIGKKDDSLIRKLAKAKDAAKIRIEENDDTV